MTIQPSSAAIDPELLKERAAAASLELVQDGMRLGLGTGSTVRHLVRLLGERVAKGLRVQCASTSIDTSNQARSLGIPLFELDEIAPLDLVIDGADEITSDLQMVKGAGAALFREKIVATSSRAFCCIADGSKFVDRLGTTRALPVEIVPFAWKVTARRIEDLGGKPVLRMTGDKPTVTDNGNYLLDCDFGAIADPAALSDRLNCVVGVCEHGLFVNVATTAILAEPDGTLRRLGK